MWKVLEDKLKLIWGDAALVVFTEHTEAFLKTKWTRRSLKKLINVQNLPCNRFQDQPLYFSRPKFGKILWS